MRAQRLTQPSLIVHCDWGTDPRKRWMAKATLRNGVYTAHAPELVGNLNDPNDSQMPLLDRIRQELGSTDAALVGFDFPIGLPAQYAANFPAADFLSLLPRFGAGIWQQFYEICGEAAEISIHRPFYPYNFTPQGSKKRQHLVDGLRVKNFNSLLRVCEQPTPDRSAAGALFWTLGAKAPGRGAIIGWRDFIAPALRNKEVKLWPFHGSLNSLLQHGAIVLSETYPTEYYDGIFGGLNGSKTVQAVRANAAPEILTWVKRNARQLQLTPELTSQIEIGFSTGNDDALDAAIGLFGMIEVALGLRLEGQHPNSELNQIEGWILGQPCP